MSNSFNMTQYIFKGKENKIVLQNKNQKITYNELKARTNQVANYLEDIGVKKGEVVSVFLKKSPEVFPIVLGILKHGAVYSPLFSSFGSSALKERISDSQPSLVITSDGLFKKLVDLDFNHKLLILQKNDEDINFASLDYYNYYKDINNYSREYNINRTNENDIASIFYTSGTTSKPKGVVHTHKEIKRYLSSFKTVLNPQKNDFYWCTADHAWITGSVYGIFAPLAAGVRNLINNDNLSAKKIYRFLIKNNINIWYTAPTFFRILLKQNAEDIIENNNFSELRSIYSVGEPLSNKTILEIKEIFGLVIKNTWFQTETGGIILANDTKSKDKYGALGKPLPDVDVSIVNDNFEFLPPGKTGRLVIKSGWSSMFINYLNNNELYNDSFRNGWYITKDLAKKDDDGYYWFVSREDDIINVAGHLVNPIEIENVLINEEFINNVIATSISDNTMGQRVKLSVVLNKDYQADFKLKLEIKKIIRQELSHYEVPKKIDFVTNFEATASGKIIR